MTTEPSELRRLLADAIPDVSIDTGHLLSALVTRLDALTEAKGAGPRAFKVGDQVVEPCFSDHLTPGTIVNIVDGVAHVKGWEEGTGIDGAWTTHVSKLRHYAAPLASGNLAAVTALLDELTPGWREETDDPLAAVRGIADEKTRAWQEVGSLKFDLSASERERDEARAKLAELRTDIVNATSVIADLRANLAEAVAHGNDLGRMIHAVRVALGSPSCNIGVVEAVEAKCARLTAAESALAGERDESDKWRTLVNDQGRWKCDPKGIGPDLVRALDSAAAACEAIGDARGAEAVRRLKEAT